MQACKEHWEQLKKAIEEKGLSNLVSKDGKQVVERIKKELNNEHTIADPLLNAWMAIVNNALGAGGVYLLQKDEEGNHYCPLCEGEKHAGPGTADWFISNAAEEQCTKAKEAGLLNNN